MFHDGVFHVKHSFFPVIRKKSRCFQKISPIPCFAVVFRVGLCYNDTRVSDILPDFSGSKRMPVSRRKR